MVDSFEGSSSTVGVMAETTVLPQKPPAARSIRSPNRRRSFSLVKLPRRLGFLVRLPKVMSAARARVAKLRTVLETLGEDYEMYDTLKASLRKVEMKSKAQEVPLSEQISATRAFIGRKLKRVDETRQASDKASTALTEVVAAQEEQERLLAEGAQIGRIPAQRADDAITVLSSACSHRSRC